MQEIVQECKQLSKMLFALHKSLKLEQRRLNTES